MICSEFLDRFSDYFDGVGDAEFMTNAEAHLARCVSCRRYTDVVGRAGELVRAAPAVRPTHDFYPRLRHRIFHVDDANALARSSAGSATSAATILGMAVLLTLVAWSPMMRQKPEVELAPIVVSRPSSQRAVGLRPPPIDLSTPVQSLPYADPFDRGHLWEHPHALLLRHSPLFERYGRNGAFRLTGLD
jgi:predicted anti-sigma-YlaC factor YlaD